MEYAPLNPSRQEWRFRLFGCMEDRETCCIGYWLPCLLYAENGRRLTGDSGPRYFIDFISYMLPCWICLGTSESRCCGCQCALAVKRRRMLRAKYGLPEGPCTDCCVHFWCHLCAQCQEARELKARETEMLSELPMHPTGQRHVAGPVSGSLSESAEQTGRI